MKIIKRYCQALDLVNDPKLIREYELLHQQIWPEVKNHILTSGVVDMQIWRVGNRLFMIMDVNEMFSFEKSAQMEQQNPVIQKWEQQMWQFQQATPWTPNGEKWIPMEKIFDLTQQ
ncbi:L-rhamnose mutarotase [Orbus mooreae]|uniref:L-rhamnose mutarotase n=1 Tax=Orbus mooreae TaxID=3074107 RepID=UPI00370D57C1